MQDNEFDRLRDAVAALREARVLCIGDLIIDTFNVGSVVRISPESPIPVFQSGTETTVPGGAANVARNIAALGGSCRLAGVVGKDDSAEVLIKAVEATPGIVPAFVSEEGRKTSHKIRYVALGQHMLRVDNETSAPISPSTEDNLLEAAIAAMGNSDVVVLSDYAKGALTDRVISGLIDAARARGLPVVVDPKSKRFKRYAGATLLTPNLKEASAAAGHALGDDDAIVEAAREIVETCDLAALLVTRSEDGMSLVERGGAVHHIRTLAQEVYDVVGAGDTVIATLAMSLAVGLAPVEAARLANIAAGIVVGKHGTATVSPSEMLDRIAELRSGGHRRGAPLLLSAEEASRYAASRRSEGKTVGFTNGVFDIVHPGHISLLEFSRSTCDRLIVGLNSDASVKRLGKGPERPINTELDRAAVLGAFGTVDAVVIFGEDTPIELIKAIKPDILIKGADYTVDTVVGADIVQAYGGRVQLAPIVTGKSSTNIIRRARLDGGNQ